MGYFRNSWARISTHNFWEFTGLKLACLKKKYKNWDKKLLPDTLTFFMLHTPERHLFTYFLVVKEENILKKHTVCKNNTYKTKQDIILIILILII